jgi:hypothetical protein
MLKSTSGGTGVGPGAKRYLFNIITSQNLLQIADFRLTIYD